MVVHIKRDANGVSAYSLFTSRKRNVNKITVKLITTFNRNVSVDN